MTKDLEIYLLYDRKYHRANYNSHPISQADGFCLQVASLLDFSISLKLASVEAPWPLSLALMLHQALVILSRTMFLLH